MTNEEILRLEDLGFVVTRYPFEKSVRISCYNCAAIAINGVPCHETGCIDERFEHECSECPAKFYHDKPATRYTRLNWKCQGCIDAEYDDSLMDYGDK